MTTKPAPARATTSNMPGSLAGRDVVHDGGARVERGRGDGRLAGVDADRDPARRRQALDDREHAAELLGFGHRIGTRAGRLAAHVEHVGAGGHQGQAVRGRQLGVEDTGRRRRRSPG